MANLTTSLKKALSTAFPRSQFRPEVNKADKRIGGVLVWDGFQDIDQIDRQRMVREALDRVIQGDPRRDIAFIITVTHAEMAVLKAG